MKNNLIQNIYIHIPFCSSKCSYCNFCTYSSIDKKLHKKYVDCLINEINGVLNAETSSLQKKGFIDVETHHGVSLRKIHNQFKIGKLRSLYFGGGTPSLIDPKLIGKIIEKFKSYVKGSIAPLSVLYLSTSAGVL